MTMGIGTAASALLDLHNVTVMRGDRTALDDVTLRIAPGERVCILGPNGCGKSTLIKTITRECYPVVRPDSWMTLFGAERWDVFALRKRFGIVSPDLLQACTTDATGLDVVLSAFFSSTQVFPHHRVDPTHRARAAAVMRNTGIAHLADRTLRTMSSGEAKRTLLARAIVHDPETLLFDEPTNALDIGARRALIATMRELTAGGRGLVLVTHHVSEIIPEIDRIVMMREGRIVASGPKAEVLTEDNLRGLFGVAVRLIRDGGYFHCY
jgi:iron complex transport system ATP-binding protein